MRACCPPATTSPACSRCALNRASISAMGAGVYFAQEGVFEFATREWGPQPVQITLSSVDCNGLSLAVAADTGVKTIADLKGKRIGFVVGSPALNQNALAMLAFANLTAKDVKIVEFASNNAMWKGVINNDVDAVFGSTIAGPAKELQTSPRGIIWPPMPHSDKAGWERVRKVGPFFTEHNATCGAGGISKDKPIADGHLSVSDLHRLCEPARGRRLHADQGDDRRL